MTTENPALAAAREIIAAMLVSNGVGVDAVGAEDRLLAARLVAATLDRAGVMGGPKNEPTSWAAVEEAVSAGVAFFVRVRRDVLALDFDEEDAVARAHGAYAALRVAGHLPVMIASGQRDRRHVFCLLRPDRRGDVEKYQRLRPHEMRPSIRPPFTPHRYRDDPLVRPALLLPNSVDEAVDRLHRRPQRRGRALGGGAVAVLKRDSALVRKTGSETIFSLAKGAANAGWTVEEFLVLLTSGTFPICKVFAARCDREGPEDSVAWVRERLWPDAAQVVTATPPRRPEDNPRGRALLAWAIMVEPWPGRTGATDRAVFLALVQKHLRSGANPVDASIREICLLAGISSRDTVMKSLRRLQSRGLVERQPLLGCPQPGGDTKVPPMLHSDAYFLADPPASGWTRADHVTAAVLHGLNQDAFRNWVGYGKRVQHVYDMIVVVPGIETAELLRRIGAGSETILQALKKLAGAELISRDEQGWRSGPRSLDEVVRGTPMAGRGELQKRVFELERRAVREHTER